MSQFFPWLWGFDRGGRKGHGSRVSRSILGLIVGSFLGVGAVTFVVLIRQDENPKTGWAWIDVVSTPHSTADSLHLKDKANEAVRNRFMRYPTSNSSSRS